MNGSLKNRPSKNKLNHFCCLILFSFLFWVIQNFNVLINKWNQLKQKYVSNIQNNIKCDAKYSNYIHCLNEFIPTNIFNCFSDTKINLCFLSLTLTMAYNNNHFENVIYERVNSNINFNDSASGSEDDYIDELVMQDEKPLQTINKINRYNSNGYGIKSRGIRTYRRRYTWLVLLTVVLFILLLIYIPIFNNVQSRVGKWTIFICLFSNFICIMLFVIIRLTTIINHVIVL